QNYIEDLNEIDRCITCHAGIDNPQMAQEINPYKTHPGNYLEHHPSDKFGCVICHGGQGRALNKREAHAKPGSEAYWENPLLPEEYIQSSCGTCHDPKKVINEAPNLARGKELMETLGCQGCHVTYGFGGALGEPIDKQGTFSEHHYTMQHLDGEHSTWNWLKQHFLDPQLIVPDSEMKKQEMTDSDAKDLTTLMLALKGKQAYSQARTPQDRYEFIADHSGYEKLNGEQLFNQMCGACHGPSDSPIRGKLDKQYNRYFPTLLNNDFTRTAPKDYILETIRKGHPGTMMPSFESGLSESMIEKIVSYIQEFGETEELAALKLQGDKERGAALFQKACVECHGSYGEGVKSPNLRNPIFQNNVSDAFIAETIRKGRENSEMSALTTLEPEATEQDIADLVAYIRQLPKIALGSAAGAIGWENFVDAEQYPGLISFYKNCSSCHTIGDGDRKGPDLKDVLQRREKQWVYQQILDPEGLVKSGDKVANELAKKFGRVMENPGIPANEVEPILQFLESPAEGKAVVAEAMAKAAEQGGGDVDRGRKLYIGELNFKNKGSSCLACHHLPGLGLFGGGTLGQDLLTSDLTSVEIASSLTNVNYKVMKDIYADKPLEADEINDVVTFIQETRNTQQKSKSKIWFVVLGIFGVIALFFITEAFWFKRLKSVRKDLIERSRK
nr:Cbb3-type cytochrome c oxidase subunit CcoP2 [Chlamydiota bacterium]